MNGGGIRGIISIEILARTLAQQKVKAEHFAGFSGNERTVP